MPRRKNASIPSRPVGTRRSTRQSASRSKQEDDVPEVFQDMLFEAFHNNPEDFAPSPRPVKRRRIGGDLESQEGRDGEENHEHDGHDGRDNREHNGHNEPRPIVTTASSPPPPTLSDPGTPPSAVKPPQTIFNDDSDSDSDSDISFEDVNISRPSSPTPPPEPTPKSLILDLSAPPKAVQPARLKTKPLTKIERLHRLNVHKWHLLCLLLHLQTISKWCDNESIQATLKPLVARKISNQLHLPETRTQAERKFSFDNAITEICHIWKLTFKITTQGMRKAQWQDNIDMAAEIENAPDATDFEDFQSAAKMCNGSRDLGAQLFCALLRSLAVDTRLVCSLQVLPFTRTSTATPQKPSYITAGAQDFGRTTSRGRKRIIDSAYPIWWIEVYSPSVTAWIPLDPLVRNTINKPRTGFEPPASDPLNGMSYVIAFEDNAATDVTRRYTALFNAKTRRTRVEVTKGGTEWYASVTRFFDRSNITDRDTIEDAALNRRVVQEGMPKNVQDLKDHPIYVLERHLRHNEVIEPRRECGKFSVGSGKNARLENVYRRENVHSCRSAEGWYRRGRDVSDGQQPLKRAARKKRATSVDLEEEEEDSVPLYAEFQTELYVPPPVANGLVPRNGFGNLDVYVASMIPAGGIHVRHTLAIRAAKLLKIDAAEAVTGFVFKGRQGTAVIDGVVIDSRFTAVMLSTITTLEDELEEEVKNQRSAILISVWKKMHAVLKVRQRIQEEYGERAGIDMDVTDDDDPDYDDGGGFMPDMNGEATKASRAEEAESLKILRDRAPVVLPSLIVKRRPEVVMSPHKLVEMNRVQDDEDLFGDGESEAGGFVVDGQGDGVEKEELGGGFVVEDQDDSAHGDGGFVAEEIEAGGFVPEGVDGGGFVPGEQDDSGGGFILDEQADPGDGGFILEQQGEPENGGGFVSEHHLSSNNHQNTSSRTVSKEGAYLNASQGQSSVPIPVINNTGGFVPENESADNFKPRPADVSLPDTSTTHPLTLAPKTDFLTLPSSQNSRRSREKRKITPVPVEDDGSQSDNSLPSHDPEEDEMEMQWVEDAFESE